MNTYLATEQVSSAVVSISSHVSCNVATRSPTTGTYSEYNITGKSFDSDTCASTSLNTTIQSKVCDESQNDDYYYYEASASNSTRYSSYCLIANRAPSSSPSSTPSYGIDSPTPAPTVFKGVKFSASQVSEKSSISVCLLVVR